MVLWSLGGVVLRDVVIRDLWGVWRQTPSTETSSGGHSSGKNTSYWNASLFIILTMIITLTNFREDSHSIFEYFIFQNCAIFAQNSL